MKKLLLFVMVIGLLFSFNGVSKAESAWVLWVVVPSNERFLKKWLIFDAFPSYKECKEVERDMRKTQEGLKEEERSGFKCLPDTIDPRK